MMTTRRYALFALVGSLLAGPAIAQAPADNYPNKPIRVVVPFPPGGGGDNQARLVLTRVAQELGQPFIFENAPGAGGNLGSMQVVRAAADGYTLLYGTNGTHGINHSLYKNPGFHPTKDFEAVGRLTSIPALLVVRPGLQVSSVSELVQLLKAKPGGYLFASAGNGTTSHLAGEMFKDAAGVDAVHVPYKGGAPAMVDVIGGRIDFMIDVVPNTAPHVQGGRVKALGASSAQRIGSFPDVPTLAESGLQGFQVTAWDAVFAPKGTPAKIVEKVNAAINKVLADPDLRKQLASRGSEPYASSPAELTRFVSSEVDRWGAAVKRSGASLD